MGRGRGRRTAGVCPCESTRAGGAGLGAAPRWPSPLCTCHFQGPHPQPHDSCLPRINVHGTTCLPPPPRGCTWSRVGAARRWRAAAFMSQPVSQLTFCQRILPGLGTGGRHLFICRLAHQLAQLLELIDHRHHASLARQGRLLWVGRRARVRNRPAGRGFMVLRHARSACPRVHNPIRHTRAACRWCCAKDARQSSMPGHQRHPPHASTKDLSHLISVKDFSRIGFCLYLLNSTELFPIVPQPLVDQDQHSSFIGCNLTFGIRHCGCDHQVLVYRDSYAAEQIGVSRDGRVETP